MFTTALGQYCEIPSHSVFTIPALILKRSSLVMPGLRGIPAGIMTMSIPSSAGPSCSLPRKPLTCNKVALVQWKHVGQNWGVQWLFTYHCFGIRVAKVGCDSRHVGYIIQVQHWHVRVQLEQQRERLPNPPCSSKNRNFESTATTTSSRLIHLKRCRLQQTRTLLKRLQLAFDRKTSTASLTWALEDTMWLEILWSLASGSIVLFRAIEMLREVFLVKFSSEIPILGAVAEWRELVKWLKLRAHFWRTESSSASPSCRNVSHLMLGWAKSILTPGTFHVDDPFPKGLHSHTANCTTMKGKDI